MDYVTADVWASGRIPGECDVAAGSTTKCENYNRRSKGGRESNRNSNRDAYKKDVAEPATLLGMQVDL